MIDRYEISGGTLKAWIAKRDLDLGKELFRVELGSNPLDAVKALVVDAAGNTHSVGSLFVDGQELGFLAVLDPTGKVVTFRRLPAPAYALALDADGNTFVGGDSYLMKAGDWMVATPGKVRALGVDGQGALYMAGSKAASAETGSYGTDAYIARIPAGSRSWDWILTFGGTGALDEARSIVFGPDEGIYVAGVTNSADLPVKNARQSRLAGLQDLFLMKLGAADRGVEWSTYLGGSGIDDGVTLSVDANGQILVRGTTDSPDFPLIDRRATQGEEFSARVDPFGRLVASFYLSEDRQMAAVTGLKTVIASATGWSGVPSPLKSGALDVANGATPSTILLSVSAPTSIFGTAVTLNAIVTAGATGQVTFFDGVTFLGSAPLSGSAASLTTRFLQIGTRSLRAFYGGNATYNVSNSATTTHTVMASRSIGFPTQSTITSIGSGPIAVAVRDFDGDGIADLAVANNASNTVSIRKGVGDGTFQLHGNFNVGSVPWAIVAADFDGDGKMDLATANVLGSNVTFLRGIGGGSFAQATSTVAGSNPISIAVGDFNTDGKPDLVVANNNTTTVSVLLGNGNGNFQPPVAYWVGTNPLSVAVGDFNGDNIADIAAANNGSDNVSVLLGVGNGTFQAATNIAAGAGPTSVAVGDFNNDGKADLVVANVSSANVSIIRGNGNGTFQPALDFPAGSFPISVLVGDFDADGNADIAAADVANASVILLLGNGNGTFQSAVAYAAGSGPRAIALGEFNGDGKPDLAVANNSSDTVSVLLGTGTIRTVVPVSGSSYQQVFNLTLGDSGGNSQIVSGRILIATGSNAIVASCHIQYDRATSSLSLMNDGGTAWLGPLPIGVAGTLQNNQCQIDAGAAAFIRPNSYGVSVSIPVSFKASFSGAKNVYVTMQTSGQPAAGPTLAGSWTIPSSIAPSAVSIAAPGASGGGGIFSASFADTNGWQRLTTVEVLVATSTGSAVNCYVGFNPSTNALAVGAVTGTLGSGTLLNGGNCQLDPVLSNVTKSGTTLTLNLSLSFLASFGGVQQLFGRATSQGGATSNWQQLGSYTVNRAPAPGGALPNNGTGLVQSFTFSFSSPNGFGDIRSGEMLFAPSLNGFPICYLYVDRPGNTVYIGDDQGTGISASAVLGTNTSARNSYCQVYGPGSSITSSGNTTSITLVIGFFGPLLGTQGIFTRARGIDASGGLQSPWQQAGTFTVSIAPVFSAISPASGAGASQVFSTVVSDPYNLTKWIQMQFSSSSTLGTIPYCYVHYDKVGNGLWLYQGPGPYDFQGPITPGTGATLSNGNCTINAAGSSLSGPVGPANNLTLNVSLTFNQAAFSGTKTVFLRAADQLGTDTGFLPLGAWTVPY